MNQIKIFVSYSHQNSDWVDENGKYGLIPWLKRQLRRENVLFWTDHYLSNHIGEESKRNIRNNVQDSDIALLLVSQEFASSDFILEFELPWIKEEFQKESLKIVPLLIDGLGRNGKRNIPWIFELQTIPNETKPIIEYTENAVEWSKMRIKILDALLDKIDAVQDDKKKEKVPPYLSAMNNINGNLLSNDSLGIHKQDGNNISSEQECKPSDLKELIEKNKRLEDELGIQKQVREQVKHPKTKIKSIPKEKTESKLLHTPFANITETVNGISFDMIAVEGGAFIMGSTEKKYYDSSDEYKHKVTLSRFFIGKTVVTQNLWKAVMGNNPSKFKGENLPVEEVSWNDCQQFIQKLNQLTNKKFSLPTEAQWEFAARGGSKSQGFSYAGSNNINEVAWHFGNSEYKTHPVGEKQANELGLYDMSGNVWEWCQDRYGRYSDKDMIDPLGSLSGAERVIRGGSCCGNACYSKVTYRNYKTHEYKHYNTGFRLALSPEK